MGMSRMSQRGDAGVVVVVILVVALIAALGFIAWQNFIKDEPATTANEGGVQQVDQQEGPVVKLSEWGVEVPVDSQEFEYGADYEAIDGGDVRGVYFIKAMIDDCEANIGAVSRVGRVDETVKGEQYLAADNVTAGQTWGELAQNPGSFGVMPVANDYVYAYTGPQALSCSAETADRETQAMRTFSQEIFPSLRASN